MDNSLVNYYPLLHDELTARMFCAGHNSQPADSADIRKISPSDPAAGLSLVRKILHVPPFVIEKWGRRYVSPGALQIDLQRLPATPYKIIAIHNFRVEDRNPNLEECLAGIFLARRAKHRWEEPEDHPLECRGIELLGFIDSAMEAIFPP